nr:hypothetical protein [uncultured Noviherbaspirillum sp.]
MTPLLETRPMASPKPGHLREKMPGVTAWIDTLRDAFGKEMVDQMIRTGLREGTFWAVEKGIVVGTPPAAVLDKHFAELRIPETPVEELAPVPLEPLLDRRWPA